MKRRGFCVFWFLGLTATLPLSAQNSDSSGALHADLSRYYFKSPADEVAGRAELNTSMDQLSRLKGRIDSPSRMLGLMRDCDAAKKIFAKHEGYLHLRCSLDRKDPAACDADQSLESEFDAKSAFVAPEILAIPEDRLQGFFRQEPALEHYRFALSDIRRGDGHALPAAQESLLAQFDAQIAEWQYGLYQQIVGGISFGSVMTASGSLDVNRQRNLIAADPDPRVREEGTKRRYAGFASQRDLLAFALLHTVEAQNALAKAHHYADAPARKYESLYFEPQSTRKLLALMAEHGDVPKRFEKIRSQDIERGYHQKAQDWDMSAPAPGFSPPATSLSQARAVFHQAFAGMGEEYQKAFDALLDPANGRADILPGGAPNRYGGGFSVGFPGSTSTLFYGRYDGTFKDLSVIAHEGGHAVHRQFMNENNVLPVYADGPHFLFESFAQFNELLLADWMAEHAPNRELQLYYRERWLSIKGLDAFYGAQDALLEQEIYDGVAAGTVRNADDLDKLTVKIASQFSIFPAATPELRGRWAAQALMFEDPLYTVNYVYGGLLALKYFQLYSTRRDWFVPRYIALLKNGFNQSPAELLKNFLEIDVSNPSLLSDDLNLLNRRLNQLEHSGQIREP
jgi:oligoendopeptidase F